MSRSLSKFAEAWWDYTTLAPDLIPLPDPISIPGS